MDGEGEFMLELGATCSTHALSQPGVVGENGDVFRHGLGIVRLDKKTGPFVLNDRRNAAPPSRYDGQSECHGFYQHNSKRFAFEERGKAKHVCPAKRRKFLVANQYAGKTNLPLQFQAADTVLDASRKFIGLPAADNFYGKRNIAR